MARAPSKGGLYVTSAPVVVLIGPPGAGKTTVGLRLAERLGVTFTDTDVEIERAAGKTIRDIFREDGEPAFRAMEREVVRAALAAHDGVLALGGGAVVDADTRAGLQAHRVAFLDVGAPEAVHRVGAGRDRPLLAGDVHSRLTALLAERRPYYEHVATWTIRTDGLTPDEVVDTLLAALGSQRGTADSHSSR
jgi:shikimate kinase